jgi:hypothetical protein
MSVQIVGLFARWRHGTFRRCPGAAKHGKEIKTRKEINGETTIWRVPRTYPGAMSPLSRTAARAATRSPGSPLPFLSVGHHPWEERERRSARRASNREWSTPRYSGA